MVVVIRHPGQFVPLHSLVEKVFSQVPSFLFEGLTESENS